MGCGGPPPSPACIRRSHVPTTPLLTPSATPLHAQSSAFFTAHAVRCWSSASPLRLMLEAMLFLGATPLAFIAAREGLRRAAR